MQTMDPSNFFRTETALAEEDVCSFYPRFTLHEGSQAECRHVKESSTK